ncbi:MAG: amino acid permease [Proteobacteria bacterium]|nr:amino acid permease [Pseudomonadota bacterium]
MTRARPLGFWMATALVVGNMIGSGTYLLPASLAPFGTASLLGWSASLGGALLLALTFAWLSRKLPVGGGPYAYARAAFGDFAGFITAWCYWVSIWCGNAAIAVAFAAYLGGVIPAVGASPFVGAACALAAVWLCTLFNVVGIRAAGWVQLITTVLKLLPLLVIAFVGAWWLEPASFEPFNPTQQPLLDVTTATVALTLWAFLGMESATVPADKVRDPDRIVPLATLVGTLVAAIATILACTVVIGLVPAAELSASGAPFANAARRLWGNAAGIAFAIAAAIACFGALNGWILMQGQIPLAAARDGLFPRRFGRENARGTPVFALVAGSGITTVLVIANFQGSLVALFTWSILLSTASVLVPYLLSMAAAVGFGRLSLPGTHVRIIAALAFAYGLWALLGTGREALAWGAGLLVAGLPIYALLKTGRSRPPHAP